MNIKMQKKFVCDRCGKELTIFERFAVFVKNQNEEYPRKKWDFCKKCYSALEKGVDNGR